MRFLARLLVQVVGNAVGLIVAATILDGVSLTAAALVLDVLVFTGVSVVALPMIQKQAIRRSEAIAGSSALITCLIALIVTVVLSDGLRIDGLTAWVAATVVVWAVSVLIGVLLPWVLLRRGVRRARAAQAAPMVRRWP
jgi:hypothetical protein